ncbi:MULTISPECIES: ribose 1,5-bisphosphate isomerase [Methanoculleus]|uniref:Ribose 1,5-bisphosphate isomerase n=2 Tax=Methanoculleus TaxID=45989 RepID=A3CX93_METMJ|nr:MULTISPECIES: ribose 1,5-bisphosphate isomerase [Methanoculleus]ABN57993.1 ribose 1,5-bisphosphate isomerase [Methanoculleus marisnigri JR1]MCC7554659.1 ribose 1,5-bisphosphate isomerase [Methanoculleus marisnigri]UYU19376.1 ribose 1,5-bisphosphate isomerase [Methanoculleus submarinus]
MVLSETAANIKSMEIRGAGRIARAAVEALADYAANLDAADPDTFKQEMAKAADILTATRPTAVSLPNAVRSVMRALDSFDSVEAARDAVLARAAEFVDHSEHAVERIAEIGARHISDGDVLLTHCNSEAALGCILEAHRQGKEIEVYATEVRPRGQGLVTIRTLNNAGIRTNYIVDSAVRYFINDVDLVVVGADAIAVNGAVVNKIGTAQIAHAAHEARTNVIVAAETYKFAPRTILGELIEIEERDPAEVLPRAVAEELPFVRVRNPAFDVTPAEYVDLIVTEQGAIPPGLAYTVIRDYLGWKIEELR